MKRLFAGLILVASRVYTSERRAPENHEYPFPMHYLIPLGTRVHIELEEIKE